MTLHFNQSLSEQCECGSSQIIDSSLVAAVDALNISGAINKYVKLEKYWSLLRLRGWPPDNLWLDALVLGLFNRLAVLCISHSLFLLGIQGE